LGLQLATLTVGSQRQCAISDIQRDGGGGFGIMYSLATGETQDLPQFTTGLPAFDNASQVTQTGMTVIEFYNQCIKPYINPTPQSPANNSTQQSDKKNE